MGHWKNYDELESSLTVEELQATLESMRQRENRQHRFHAALQGIDLDDASTPAPDITTLSGTAAAKAGFGIGQGLGYEVQGG